MGGVWGVGLGAGEYRLGRSRHIVFGVASFIVKRGYTSQTELLLQIQCTSDIVATLGHPFMATIHVSDWPLYPT